MRIAVLHSAVPEGASPDEIDTLVQAEAISGVLEAAGHEVVAIPCGLDLAAAKAALLAVEPALVFNLVESLDGSGRLIHLAPALVERLGFPMTGCPSDGIFLTSNKLLAKEALRAAGLPVPAWFALPARKGAPLPPLPPGRLIVKSLWEHASVGLGDGSVVSPAGADALAGELERRRAPLGGDAFAEQFVDGREFNLSVLDGPGGPRVLPPAEIRFVDYPEGKPRIVDFRAKWETDSFEYAHTVRSLDFPPGDAPLLDALGSLALRAFDAFGLRGYARVDFRVDASGAPFILEVNANPCLSPDAGFAAAAGRAGMGYADVVLGIAAAALGDVAALAAPGRREAGAPAAGPAESGDAAPAFREIVTPGDRDGFESLLRGTGFFSDAEVAIALELVDAFIAEGTRSGYHFLVCEQGGELLGFSTYGPIPGTASSYDLYWIAVHRRHQRRGLGVLILAETEARIRALGGTRVYAETSGRDLYHPTRSFYDGNGYAQEARIKNYYGHGDDQVIYGKVLS